MSDRQQMRAADQDRQQVVDRLRGAVTDGRLTLDEFVDRMGRAYQAVTYADLAPLCADLPAAGPVTRRGPAGPAATAAPVARPAGPAAFGGLPAILKVLWTIWLTAVSVNVVVWVLTCVTSGHFSYPWPLWVGGPYGAVLLAVSVAAISFRRRPLARPPQS